MPVNDRTSEFVALFAAHDRGVYKYILMLLADPHATQEVFQETSVTLWQKFEEFEPGSNFFAWACRVAYFEVMKYRQTCRRDRLRFGEDMLRTLADDWPAAERLLRPGARPCPTAWSGFRPATASWWSNATAGTRRFKRSPGGRAGRPTPSTRPWSGSAAR